MPKPVDGNIVQVKGRQKNDQVQMEWHLPITFPMNQKRPLHDYTLVRKELS
jgi:hypothetical protein